MFSALELCTKSFIDDDAARRKILELEGRLQKVKDQVAKLKKIYNRKNTLAKEEQEVDFSICGKVGGKKDADLVFMEDYLGAKFTKCVIKTSKENNYITYELQGKSHCISWEIIASVIHEDNGMLTINDLSIDYNYTVVCRELDNWVESCVHSKNMQTFLHGIGKYAKLVDDRKAVLQWLEETYPGLLSIHNSDTPTMVKVGNVQKEEYLFVVKWKIIRDHKDLVAYWKRSLTVVVEAKGREFAEDNTNLLALLSRTGDEQQFIDAWRALLDVAQTA